jgi:hypothetical protein
LDCTPHADYGAAGLLDDLAAKSRIQKATLLREAVNDLLVKHKVLKVAKVK